MAARCGLVVAAALLIGAAGCSSSDDTFTGTVQAPAEEADTQPGRWAVTIQRDRGATTVAFDEADLICEDGGAHPGPSALAVGDRVSVDIDPDGEVATMDPPIVGGLRVRAECDGPY